MGNVKTFTREDGKLSFQGPDGEYVWVKPDEAQKAVDAGLRPEGVAEFLQRERWKEAEDSKGKALLSGVARGATLGLSDLALRSYDEELAREVDDARIANPKTAFAGDVAGLVGTALIPGGGVLGLAGKAGSRLATQGAAKLGMAAVGTARAARLGSGVAQGALASAGLEFGQQALRDQFDPKAIAQKAAWGAATASALSLAGMGISAASGRVRGALAQQSAKRASEVAALRTTKRILEEDAKRLAAGAAESAGGGVSRFVGSLKSGTPPSQVAQRLKEVTTQLQAVERTMWHRVGDGIKAQLENVANRPLGTDVMLLAATGHIGAAAGRVAAKYGATEILKRAPTLVPALKEAAAAGGAAVSRAASVAKDPVFKGAVVAMTPDVARKRAEEVRDLNPAEIRQAATDGFAAAGLEPDDVRDLANMQSERAAMLKEAAKDIATAAGRMRFALVHRAATDPAGILKRAQSFKLVREDVEAIARLFPKSYRAMREEATEQLDAAERSGKPILGARRRQLELQAGIQRPLPPQAQQQKPASGFKRQLNVPSAQTPMQRIQSGGGIGRG